VFDSIGSLLGNATDRSIYHLAQASPAGGIAWILPLIVGLVLGAIVVFAVNRLMGNDAKSKATRLLDQAKLDCENLIKTAELEKKEKLLQLQSKFDSEMTQQREELRNRESQLERKDQLLKQSSDDLKNKEKLVESTQRKLAEKMEDANRKSQQYDKMVAQAQNDLQRVTGLSKEEAKRQLLSLMEKELQGELGQVILQHEKKVSEVAQQKAQDILLTAMQRYASSQTSESTTSSIDIPNDEGPYHRSRREKHTSVREGVGLRFDHRRYARRGHRQWL
jgi:ribonuclease Y